MTIRPKIQEIFENANKFKLVDGNLRYKEGDNIFIINPKNNNDTGKIYITIDTRNSIRYLDLNEEESDLLNSIFILVYERRIEAREEERSKMRYEKELERILKNREKQLKSEEILNNSDFTKDNEEKKNE